MRECEQLRRRPRYLRYNVYTVDTPININEFEGLLANHPNPLFVQSVAKGLCNGFWPWADTHLGEYPDTLDESLPDPKDNQQREFICA